MVAVADAAAWMDSSDARVYFASVCFDRRMRLMVADEGRLQPRPSGRMRYQ
jgi:hypothetical protein